MKHIFTSFLIALLATTAVAQEETTFSFLTAQDGTVVPNGATLNVGGYNEIIPELMYDFLPEIYVKNNSGEKVGLSLKLVANDEKGRNFMICIGGSCIPYNEANNQCLNETAELAGNAVVDAEVHANLIEISNPLEYKTTFTLTAKPKGSANENDAVTITVNFDPSVENAYVSSLNELVAKNEIKVYNLCGKFVSNSMKGLQKGIYVVNQNGKSRKMVVK